MSDLIPWVTLWFIMTNGSGYLPPMEVRSGDSVIQCNITGAIVGLQIDKLENPTKALWPDPYDTTKHCEVDISAKVNSLVDGEYHSCTTQMGVIGVKSHNPIDPHCSVYWIKSKNPMTVIPSVRSVRVQ